MRHRQSLLSLLALMTVFALSCGEPQPLADAPVLGLPPLTQFTTDPAIERDAAWSPDGKWISFGSLRGGNEDIWKKPVGGGDAIQLTAEPSSEIYAIWSPDGSKLAFTSDKGGVGNVWTVDADGGEMTRVTADEDSVSLRAAGGSIVSWSPDGEWIAFSSVRSGVEGSEGDIRVVPAAGGPSRAVTSGPEDDFFPSWSPDGEWIAFASDDRSGNADVWVVPATGGDPRQLTTDPADDVAASWSPDGKWMAFQSDRSGELHIWIIPSAGGTAMQVTGRPGVADVVARWSPDGTKISFNSLATSSSLWIMPADGDLPRSLEVVAWGGLGSWSPDGSEIAFLNDVRGVGRDVFVVPRSGGEPRPVTRGGAVSATPSFTTVDWSPAGDALAFAHGDQDDRDIWSVSAAGGEPNPVTVSAGQVEDLPRFSPDGRQIAYTGEGEAGAGIWTVPASGGLPTPVVDWRGGAQWSTAWSPDQTRIAFTSRYGPDGERFPNFQIWTASVMGGSPTRLAEGVHPDWSPDGREVLYSRLKLASVGIGGDIWKVPAAGGDPVPVLESPEGKFWPRWSPDGAEILYGRPVEVLDDIFIVDVSSLINR